MLFTSFRNGCFTVKSMIRVVAVTLAIAFGAGMVSAYYPAAAEKLNDVRNVEGQPEKAVIEQISDDGLRLVSGDLMEYVVDIPTDSVYTLSLYFRPVAENTQSVAYSVKIDGAYPLESAQNLRADCIYENDGEISTLSNGDQVAPPVRHINGTMRSIAYDIDSTDGQPVALSLTAGRHTVTVTALENAFFLYGIRLTPPEEPMSYADYCQAHSDVPLYDGEQLVLEGENARYKNAYSVSLRSDTESAVVTPADPTASMLNYIGGTTWKDPGQQLVWTVNVPRDGLYKIAFSFKQSTVVGGYVYRTLRIDEAIPFKEAAELGFGYSPKWQFCSLGEDAGESYRFYLSAGVHTLSLTVTLGDAAAVSSQLQSIAQQLGDTYLDIVMITGETPDANRDYELHKQIPDFKGCLETCKKDIDALSRAIDTEYRVNGELNGALKNMSRILGDMLSGLYNAHLYVGTYYSYYQTLCSWLYDIRNMSMSLDKIVIAAPERSFERENTGFFSRVAFAVRRFASSFSGDYSVTSLANEDAATIKLWVNWGRDQVKVLNSLISSRFSPSSGINVRVEQVNASLVQGVISDNSPDVYLHLSRTEPVNLAMRGVIYDLSRFDDFDQVLTQFAQGAETPYAYHGGVYALPDTQSFNVLFYRADILDELGLSVPKTWDEFLAATAVLQRKNMNVYLPYVKITADTTVNTGAGGLTIFPTMLLQSGGSLYNTAQNATGLTEPVAVSAFRFWTDFYARYSLNVDTNFTQRFRVGTIPLGIAPYTQYLTFSAAAPEIRDKWKIAEIPGFVDAQGQVNNICADGGSGCVIMNSSKQKQAAWEFLKWWVSADTQYEYSTNVESVIGVSGRVATSNMEALSRMSWDKDSLSVILSQWKKVQALPEVPGSYYVSRSIDQAFWAVYNNKSTPKEAISEWGKISDDEIRRKIEEYADRVCG